jgi:hypothetical protein
MPVFNEALEWRDRAEQAREVAWLLSDPGAKQAVLQLGAGGWSAPFRRERDQEAMSVAAGAMTH